ncbi:MAG: DinB family protein [Armatimonadota bacterium]|nr:DinB family protein [Armatimonadota bacterium]
MQPFATMYEYLVKARERIFDWVRPLAPQQYQREFPYALKTIHATLVHTASAEWVYGHRLRGQPVALADSPFTTERMTVFAQVESAWRTLAGETRALLGQITDWDALVESRMYPQGPANPAVRVRATKAGIASQLVFHEVHHRSQVMSMLKQLGVAAQNLDYSALMFDRQAEPPPTR